MSERYDVAILGGGLAGLCLGLQLKRARPDTSILIAEKRKGPAPDAAFKVGESTTEIAARYFGHVVGMRDHLEADQIKKFGLRFFPPENGNTDISRRIEMGIPFYPPTSTYQIDRGRFENELAKRNQDQGNEVLDGCVVRDVQLGEDEHVVTLERDGEQSEVTARWVVDGAGRAKLLKSKLGLAEDNAHNINSCWWRLDGGLKLDEWSDDAAWRDRIPEPNTGQRFNSTNHLMGEGYWVWLIPLVSGAISIGICSDPRYHPWDKLDTYEKAVAWLREHEPQLAAALEGREGDVVDFLKLENFSHGCKRCFSPERWAVTGDAGAFVDPLFSPGSNYIAMSNTLIGDLIVHDLDGDDIQERAEHHNELYLRMYEHEMLPYIDFYPQFKNTQIVVGKIAWGNIAYWALTGFLFYKDKLADWEFMKDAREDMERGWALIARMNEFWQQWHELEQREYGGAMVKMVEFLPVPLLHVGLEAEVPDVRAKFTENVELMEAVAVGFFHHAANRLLDADLGEDQKINPYAISLKRDNWEPDGLFDGSGVSLADARERIQGIENIFLDKIAQESTPVS